MKHGILGLMLFLSGLLLAAPASDLYPFSDPKQSAQFEHLLRDLRCLVCQNQDLVDSEAGLAQDLRWQIYQQVRSGKSDTEIMDYLTARFGDFILFKPPVNNVTLLLWFGPVLFLLLGFLLFKRTLHHD